MPLDRQPHLRIRPSPHSRPGLLQENARLKLANENLVVAANIDPVTGIYNRTFFNTEVNRISQSRHHCHIFMIDVDNFKTINDGYGHPIGDKVLIATAKVLTESFRKDEIVCRIGGDEFSVLMINENDEDMEKDERIGKSKIQNIKKNLIKINEEIKNVGIPPFSISIGHAIHPLSPNANIHDAIRKADNNLYDNKKLKSIN